MLLYLMYFTSESAKSENLVSFNVHVDYYEVMPMNSSGALTTYKTRSMLNCATGCFSNEGTAFCYRKSDRLCYCFAEQVKLASATSNDITTPANALYLYGNKVVFLIFHGLNNPNDKVFMLLSELLK